MSILETRYEIQQAEENLRRLRQRLENESDKLREELQQPLDPEHELKFYRWPASRLTRADMIRLTELRQITRRPITKLIHEAVVAYHQFVAGKEVVIDQSPPTRLDSVKEQ